MSLLKLCSDGMHLWRKVIWIILFVTCSAVFAQGKASTAYAYSVLAPGQSGGYVIYGRVILPASGQTCPTLTGSDGSTVALQARAMYPNGITSSASFPVTVCEAVLIEGLSYEYTPLNITLNTRMGRASKVAVFGDSGCHGKSNCPGDTASPHFAALAAVAAKQKIQLLLHMGDYNYRGTSGAISGNTYAYDAGDGGYGGPSCGLDTTYYSQNATGSTRPDNWPAWQADFFEAAKPILGKAPWVFTRGNHELCSRAGPGWFYFFGPGSSLKGAGLAQMQCPDQGDLNSPPATAKPHIMMIPPYMLALKNYSIWVSDSANACDALAPPSLTAVYKQQFESLAAQTDQPTMVITHRPIWGYQGAGTISINQMLQRALADSKTQAFPQHVFLSLAGHMHLFEALGFSNTRPPQLVIGNSGVEMQTAPADGAFSTTLDGLVANGYVDQQFGYLQMKVGKKGKWKGKILDSTGSAIYRCGAEISSGCKPTN